MILDALGNEIVIGNWYGYSRNEGGFSHATLGKAKSVSEKTKKVRLEKCIVKRYLYGQPSLHRLNSNASEVSMSSTMIFPVPRMD